MYRLSMACIAALGLATSVSAQELSLRGPFSGLWYNPEQDGHGIKIEIISPREADVTWYAYDPAGNPLWLLGTGPIRGNELQIELSSYSGAGFPPGFDPDDVVGEPWGQATFTFEDCDTLQVSWTPDRAGFEAGSTGMTRLTNIHGLACGAAEAFHQTFDFHFDAGPGNWAAVFADYSESQQDSIDTEARWAQLPAPLADRDGYMLGGTNTPDSLAMFLKAPIGGLQPDTDYQLELAMTFATNEPQGCSGIGGSPGSSVFVKLGASTAEPLVQQQGDDFRLNVDKGNQSNGGDDAVVVGDMANFQTDCTDDAEWQLKSVSTGAADFSARTDPNGRLWVFGGTDSGFEGRTVYYITKFTVRLTAAEL